MAIFGRRRIKDIKQREFFPPADVREIPEMLERAEATAPATRPPIAQSQEQKKEEGAGAQPVFAPLFVKLTRYRQILSALNSLKMNINLIRNQLLVLSELDRLREENLKLLSSAVNKVNDRLMKLDSEFMRPSGFMEEMPELQMQDVESLENTLTDLKSQIEQLKSEVETIA